MYIGIDIGGTNIRVASSESATEPKIIDKIAFPNSLDYETNEAAIIQAIRTFGSQVGGIGIGMMGRLNAQRTGITDSRSAPHWVGKPIGSRLAEIFHCPVIVNGDQCCGALSEAIASGRHDDFFYITYGTGIGCARVTYEQGKPAVQKITDEEHAVYCGPWQDDCGGKWVEQTYGKPIAELSETEWATVMGRFYDYFLKLLTELRPPRVVFGGGVAVKQWPRLQAAFAKLKAEHPELQPPEINLAYYGEEAGLYGALYLLRNS